MALDALAGLSNDLITRSWMASNTTKPFHKEEEGNTVFFGFKSSFLEKDLFDPENESPFGETKMNREQFPCMRSIGNDVDATVNEAFLKNLQLLVSTSFPHSVKTVVDSMRSQRIVFTGHSSGGATAILATVWYLETYFTKQSGFFPEPLCLTFGAPLVGDYVFKHALGRENWSRFFVNFVTRFDIVPRIMLARKASTKQDLPRVLSQLDPRAGNQGNDQSITGFFATVMKDTATVAHQAVCKLIGNGEPFLKTLSSFLELSPYRPAGTFVFSTGTRLVSVSNSDAILQILFYASQSSNEQELILRPYQSISDHRSYEEMVHSMGMKVVSQLDLHHLPLNGEESALGDLGLSTRARQCVHAAFEAEKKRVDNQSKIDAKQPKIVEKLVWIEDEYKPKCLTHKIGYYDSFKESNEEKDFRANVIRAELAGIYDEVLGLVKEGQLPDGFEGRIEWIDLANRYRRLIEPLDISNYHRHLKNEDTGPYMIHGRPNRYKHSQRGYEHELLKAGRSAEEIKRSDCGSCFWAEVEELRRKEYDEARVKKLEELLEGWIRDKEVDEEHIFLEGSSFRKWWHSLPEVHRCGSSLRVRMG
ncbi:Protein EDS1B [Raphanus sativus]|uniref:Protein EDS1B n=1 Tax=Raphanus sativus TaxID=3726 RepID=A0A9W3CX67_RAPSA|nr:protein EDS1B [Raphanus sativus]KAJ4910439.1 Protein EDS1B [Raphanus sativus]